MTKEDNILIRKYLWSLLFNKEFINNDIRICTVRIYTSIDNTLFKKINYRVYDNFKWSKKNEMISKNDLKSHLRNLKIKDLL